MSDCKFCQNGWLDNKYGEDVECVRGVLIDIDVATEGWQRDVNYPAAPCMSCDACNGSGQTEPSGDECRACNGTGWRSGFNESQERLEAWAAPEAEGVAPVSPVPFGDGTPTPDSRQDKRADDEHARSFREPSL